MKWFTGVVVAVQLAAAVSAVSFFSLLHDEWEVFKLRYGKTYKSNTEENFRMMIFLENKKMIAEHNQMHALGKKSYSVGMNEFGDMLHSEFVSIMNGFRWNGTKGIHSGGRSVSGATFIGPDDDVALPETVNWVDKGAVTPIKNQELCGSCWAFSTTGSLEGQHFRKTGQLVSLSEQNLVDCTLKYGNYGCRGGTMDLAFQYIKDNGGIDTEDSYPYEGHDETCHFRPNKVGAKETGFVDIPSGNEEALKKAVATVGPISIAIDASDHGFMVYKDGIYEFSECSRRYLDHAVLAVGYGTENGVDYWLIKNSWGTVWGKQGYGKMRRNFKNMCGVATLASYPLV